MTLSEVLRKALAIMRDDRCTVRLETATCRYRLTPSKNHARGYAIAMSAWHDDAWQPWLDVRSFDVEDILCDEWRLV